MKTVHYLSIVISFMLFSYDTVAQMAAADNKVSESVTYSDPPKGRGLYGIFEGRTPCDPIAYQLSGETPANCDHLKWQIIFFRDTVTGAPANFIFTTELFNHRPQPGKWRILKKTKTSTDRIIYRLDIDARKKPLFLWKADDNVLFILDDQQNCLTGNENFSYTLNRVQKVRKPLPAK
jgi:hypothetical protein